MDRTIDVLTTKKKVKMESHKESEGQMEVGPGELCQCDISFIHFFKGTIFQVLLPECSEMLGLCARQARKPANLGYTCQKIRRPLIAACLIFQCLFISAKLM